MESFFLATWLALATPSLPIAATRSVAVAAKEKLILTDKSVVILDGKPVAFADVPAGADVVNLEVAADMKTIVRIEFQSKP